MRIHQARKGGGLGKALKAWKNGNYLPKARSLVFGERRSVRLVQEAGSGYQRVSKWGNFILFHEKRETCAPAFTFLTPECELLLTGPFRNIIVLPYRRLFSVSHASCLPWCFWCWAAQDNLWGRMAWGSQGAGMGGVPVCTYRCSLSGSWPAQSLACTRRRHCPSGPPCRCDYSRDSYSCSSDPLQNSGMQPMTRLHQNPEPRSVWRGWQAGHKPACLGVHQPHVLQEYVIHIKPVNRDMKIFLCHPKHRMFQFSKRDRSLLNTLRKKYPPEGNSLAVQWLGLHAFTAEGLGSISGQGTKIPRGVIKKF